jgi:hypothetical protein
MQKYYFNQDSAKVKVSGIKSLNFLFFILFGRSGFPPHRIHRTPSGFPLYSSLYIPVARTTLFSITCFVDAAALRGAAVAVAQLKSAKNISVIH